MLPLRYFVPFARPGYLVLAVTVLTIACAGSPRVPAPGALPAGDPRVDEAHVFERRLDALGLLFEDDPVLAAYVDAVGRRVAARLSPRRFRFGILRDPTVNAFALPNGAVYVHLGLLARLENEAQLAHVLGHEAAHVIGAHHEKRIRSKGRKTAIAKIVDVLLAPVTGVLAAGTGAKAVPAPVDLSLSAWMNRHGTGNEREADREGLRAMAAAGYRPREALRLYPLLDVAQAGTPASVSPARHPPTAARTRDLESSFAAAGVTAPDEGEIRREEYLAVTRESALRSVGLWLDKGRYPAALGEIRRFRRARGDDPRLSFLEAETRRLMTPDRREVVRDQRDPLDSIRTVAIVPPEVEFVHLTFREDDPPLAEEAAALGRQLPGLLAAEIAARGFVVRPVGTDGTGWPLDADMRLRATHASAAFLEAGVGLDPKTKDRGARRRRSLGPQVAPLAAHVRADALVFTHAAGFRKTGGEAAADLVRSLLVAPIPGAGSVRPARGARLHIALVDGDSGEILWSDTRGTASGVEGAKLETLVKEALSRFPPAGRAAKPLLRKPALSDAAGFAVDGTTPVPPGS